LCEGAGNYKGRKKVKVQNACKSSMKGEQKNGKPRSGEEKVAVGKKCLSPNVRAMKKGGKSPYVGAGSGGLTTATKLHRGRIGGGNSRDLKCTRTGLKVNRGADPVLVRKLCSPSV